MGSSFAPHNERTWEILVTKLRQFNDIGINILSFLPKDYLTGGHEVIR